MGFLKFHELDDFITLLVMEYPFCLSRFSGFSHPFGFVWVLISHITLRVELPRYTFHLFHASAVIALAVPAFMDDLENTSLVLESLVVVNMFVLTRQE